MIEGHYAGATVFQRQVVSEREFTERGTDASTVPGEPRKFAHAPDDNAIAPEDVALAAWSAGANWRQHFPNEAAEVDPAALAAGLRMFEDAAHERLAERRSSLLETTVLPALTRNGDPAHLRESLDALSGARDLVEAYVALAMPRTLATQDDVRALLFGSQRLPDGDDVASALRTQGLPYLEALLVGKSQDGSVDGRKVVGGRIDEFARLVTTILRRPGFSEEDPVVADALARLRTFRSIALSAAGTGAHPVAVGGPPRP